MKTKLIVVLISFLTSLTYSQGLEPNIVQDITPGSPETSNLNQYGAIQVGSYTGKPDINVPIYNVKTGDLQFPINLYYDASGIRVNQEATWVGLGWELSTVAAITYKPSGGNDQKSPFHINHVLQSMYPWENHVRLINKITGGISRPYFGYEYAFPSICYPPLVNGIPVAANSDVIARIAPYGYAQIDYFQINCFGLSGSFYIHPGTGQIKAYGEKNKYHIEMLANSSGFEITSEKGMKYIFNKKEIYYTTQLDNAWYLTEIRSPNNHWIRFKYENFGLTTPIKTFTEYIGGRPDVVDLNAAPHVNEASIRNTLEPQYLTEIETNLETITFNLSSNRDDLEGASKRKLSSIKIEGKLSDYEKNIVFNYDYFNGSNTGGDYYSKDPDYNPSGTLYVTPTHFKKRLKLLGITETGGSKEKTYTFDYNQTPLPYKTSFSKDFWGFYNGEDNDTFIPNLTSIMAMDGGLRNTYVNNIAIFEKYFGSEYDLNDKAKRGASGTHMKAGVLTAINYPTGGRTVFNFEPHTFRNQVILSTSEDNEVNNSDQVYTVYANGHSSATYSAEFHISNETLVTLKANINNRNGDFTCAEMAGTSARIFGPNGTIMTKYLEFNCAELTSNGGYQSIEQDILLQAGTYVLMAISSSDITTENSWDRAVVSASVRYSSSNLDNILDNHSESIGGGLRINEIINYDSDNQILNRKTYSYINENNETSGLLISKLKMVRLRNYYCTTHPNNSSAMRYTNSTRNTFSVPMGATVGYNRVIEEQIDNNLDSNGKTVKYFNNHGLDPMFSFLSYDSTDSNLRNGTIDSIVYYNQSGNKVKKDFFDYDLYDYERNFVNIFSEFISKTGNCNYNNPSPWNECDGNPVYPAYVYPYKAYKYLLTEKTTINYLLEENLEQTLSYTYNMNNYLPKTVVFKNSNGKVLSTESKYPSDFSSEPYTTMTSTMNWLTPLIEQIEKIDGITTSANKTDYASWVTGIVPKYIKTKKGNETYEQRVNYLAYDTSNNLIQVQKDKGGVINFRWAYNNSFPVIKAMNTNGNLNTSIATSLPSEYSSLEDLVISLNAIFSNVTQQNRWKSFNNTLRSSLPKAMITTYTYNPLVGVTSITDTKGYTTYYNYDDFNRLKQVKDANGKILSATEYHYKN